MGQWMPAWEAMMKMRNSEFLSGNPDPADAARKKILEALTGGRLRASARYIIQECDDGQMPDYHVQSAKDVQLIPHGDQQQSEFAIFDTTLPLDFFGFQSGWQWKSVSWELGRLLAVKTTTTEGDHSLLTTRRYVDGLAFNPENLDALLAPPEAQTIAQQAALDGKKKRPGQGGRPVLKDEWLRFWLLMLRFAKDGKLNRSTLISRDKTLHRVQEEFYPLEESGINVLSDSSMQKAIRDIWKEIIIPDEKQTKLQ